MFVSVLKEISLINNKSVITQANKSVITQAKWCNLLGGLDDQS